MPQPEREFVSADVDDRKDQVGRDQDAVIGKRVNGRIADFSVNLSRNGRSEPGTARLSGSGATRR